MVGPMRAASAGTQAALGVTLDYTESIFGMPFVATEDRPFIHRGYTEYSPDIIPGDVQRPAIAGNAAPGDGNMLFYTPPAGKTEPIGFSVAMWDSSGGSAMGPA